jgi:hypothetical protein
MVAEGILIQFWRAKAASYDPRNAYTANSKGVVMTNDSEDVAIWTDKGMESLLILAG